MGRFDDLTKANLTPPSFASDEEKARKTANPQEVFSAKPKALLPAKPQVGKTANPFTLLTGKEKVEKYTTRLEPSLIKQIKVYAAENDIDDYEVVKRAVEAYLGKEK